MRRTTQLAVTAALGTAIGLTGCGKDNPRADTSATSSPTTDSPTSASPSTTTTSPTPAPSPTQTARLSRAHPGRLELVRADGFVTKGTCKSAPKQGVVCGPGGQGYRFDPGRVHVVGVVRARAMLPLAGGTWAIRLSLGPVGTRTFAKLTRTAARTHESAVLLVPGSRRVVVAAQVQNTISDGEVEISGDFDRAKANRIVKLVTATAG